MGMRMLDSQSGGGEVVVRSIVDFLGGSVVLRSEVSEIVLETRGGFDVGRVLLGPCEMTFWNEYMTLELCRKRLGTFPDLIMTLREDSGLPVTTAELCKGDRVFVIHVPAERLILGEGMRCGGTAARRRAHCGEAHFITYPMEADDVHKICDGVL